MPNTYTQILIQIVFAVQGRENLILENFRQSIEKYICGIIVNKKSKPLAIYCNPDHCHVLIGLDPTVSIADLARDIKANSSKWINQQRWIPGKFSWQEGYGAFSYSKSQLDNVVQYIRNQPTKHVKQSFRQEYLELLKNNEIDFHDNYLFDF